MPGDPYTAPAQLGPYTAELAVPPGKLRIGFATRRITPEGTMAEADPDCIAAVEHAAKLLASLGHEVEHAEIEAMRDPGWVPNFLAVWAVGVTHDVDWASSVLGRAIEPGDVEPLTWGLAELGRLITGPAYVAAWEWLRNASRRIATFHERYDLWLTPTIAVPPPPLGTFKSPEDDILAGIFRSGEVAPFTLVFNATGQPAASLPLYRNAAGLPIGVQLVAAYGREDLLFRISAQIEAAQPFVHAATRH
jgi:amidase